MLREPLLFVGSPADLGIMLASYQVEVGRQLGRRAKPSRPSSCRPEQGSPHRQAPSLYVVWRGARTGYSRTTASKDLRIFYSIEVENMTSQRHQDDV